MDFYKSVTGKERPWHYRARLVVLKRWWRMEWRFHRINNRIKRRFPRLVNEGEATARVIDDVFGGYPMERDFETKEDAVRLLQAIWDVVDNWDGSRINVAWSQGRKLPEGGIHAWARSTSTQ